MPRKRTKPTPCGRIGCLNVGSWRVIVWCPAMGECADLTAKADTPMLLCPVHKHEVTKDDILTPDVWGMLQRLFDRQGHIPDRGRTRLSFEPLA